MCVVILVRVLVGVIARHAFSIGVYSVLSAMVHAIYNLLADTKSISRTANLSQENKRQKAMLCYIHLFQSPTPSNQFGLYLLPQSLPCFLPFISHPLSPLQIQLLCSIASPPLYDIVSTIHLYRTIINTLPPRTIKIYKVGPSAYKNCTAD